jgi:hypothetical protein
VKGLTILINWFLSVEVKGLTILIDWFLSLAVKRLTIKSISLCVQGSIHQIGWVSVIGSEGVNYFIGSEGVN